MKNVLVTGGYGFIGSHVVDELVKNNYNVTVVDNMSTGKLSNLSHINNLKVNLIQDEFDSMRILSMVRDGKFYYVMHLAANASVPFSVERPVETNNNNVTKTLLLLEACRVGKIKKFVFSSSSSVYGNNVVFPTAEDSKKNPISPYALQKSIIEEYCKLYYELYGLKSVCLRYFNVFGPRQAGSGPYANVISSWCEKAIKHNEIRVDGEGKAFRDFIHVHDVAKANLLAANSEIPFGCYNIGSGQTIQISEILKVFQQVFSSVKVVNAPQRQGDPERTQAEITLAKQYLGFSPSFVTKDTFISTFNWYKGNVK